MARRSSFIWVPLFVLATAATAEPRSSESDRPPLVELRLAGATFRPLAGEAAAPAWLRTAPVETSPRGRRYLIAITRSSLDPGQRRLIEAAGAELLDYLPVHGYRVRLLPIRA